MPSRSASKRDGRCSRARAFLAHAGGIDVAFAIEGERRDLFLGSAVQDEAFAGRRNAVYQAAAIGAGNQVALRIERQHADVGLVALEENRVLALGSDFVDLAVVAGGDVQVSGLVENEVPDVFRAGREILGRTPRGIQRGLGRILRRFFIRRLRLSDLAEFALLLPACVRSCRPCRRARWPHRSRRRGRPSAPAPGVPAARK